MNILLISSFVQQIFLKRHWNEYVQSQLLKFCKFLILQIKSRISFGLFLLYKLNPYLCTKNMSMIFERLKKYLNQNNLSRGLQFFEHKLKYLGNSSVKIKFSIKNQHTGIIRAEFLLEQDFIILDPNKQCGLSIALNFILYFTYCEITTL